MLYYWLPAIWDLRSPDCPRGRVDFVLVRMVSRSGRAERVLTATIRPRQGLDRIMKITVVMRMFVPRRLGFLLALA